MIWLLLDRTNDLSAIAQLMRYGYLPKWRFNFLICEISREHQLVPVSQSSAARRDDSTYEKLCGGLN